MTSYDEFFFDSTVFGSARDRAAQAGGFVNIALVPKHNLSLIIMLETKEGVRRRLSKRLDEIEISRQSLLNQLANLDAESRALWLECNRAHNECAGISSLPREILAEIFETATTMYHCERPPIEILLSQVTHHWREVALDAPKLWSRIANLNNAPVYLQRSKSVLFTLEVSLMPTYIHTRSERSHDEDIFQTVFKMMPSHLHRCRRLSVHCLNQREVDHFIPCLRSSTAPYLKSMQLTCRSLRPPSLTRLPVFSDGFPSLESLCLANLNIQPFIPALKSVTTIKFTAAKALSRMDLSEFCTALCCAPLLRELEITGDVFCAWEPSMQIVLPSLRPLLTKNDLGSSLCGLLQTLSAPSLDKLTLKNVPFGAIRGFLEPLAHGSPPKFPLLHTLELGPVHIGLQRIIEVFPTIEHIIFDTWAIDIPASLSLLHTLGYWPHLHTLTITCKASLEDVRQLLLA